LGAVRRLAFFLEVDANTSGITGIGGIDCRRGWVDLVALHGDFRLETVWQDEVGGLLLSMTLMSCTKKAALPHSSAANHLRAMR